MKRTKAITTDTVQATGDQLEILFNRRWQASAAAGAILSGVLFSGQSHGAGNPQNRPPQIQLAHEFDLGLGCGGVPGTIQVNPVVTDDGRPKEKHLSFVWTIVGVPAGTSRADYSLGNANQKSCVLTVKTDGPYKLSLTVSDGEKSSSAVTTVTAAYSPADIAQGPDIQGYINYNNYGVNGAVVTAICKGVPVARTYSDTVGHYNFTHLPGSLSKYSVHASLNGKSGELKNCALLIPCRFYWYGASGCNVNLH